MNALTFAILLLGCFSFAKSDECQQNIVEDFGDGRLNLFRFSCQLGIGVPVVKNTSETTIPEPSDNNGYLATIGFIKCFETSNLWFTSDFELSVEYYFESHFPQRAEVIISRLGETEEVLEEMRIKNLWYVQKFSETVKTPGYYKIKINADALTQDDYLFINSITITSTPRVPDTTTEAPTTTQEPTEPTDPVEPTETTEEPEVKHLYRL